MYLAEQLSCSAACLQLPHSQCSKKDTESVKAHGSTLDALNGRRSWDEERSSLVSQIEALRKEARLYVASNKGNTAAGLTGDGSVDSPGGPGSAAGEDRERSPEAQLAALKRALDEAKENEVSEMDKAAEVAPGMQLASRT